MASGQIFMMESMNLKRNRVVQAMERAQLDALIGASPENAVYLSGAYNPIRRLIPERPAIVLWPKEGSPLLIAAAIEEAFLLERSAISDLWLYQGATEAAVSMLADALGKQQLLTARLGIDLEGISAYFFQELHRRVPAAKFQDSTRLFAELRAVKNDEEVEVLRHAAQSTDYAEWRALEAFRAGWTEIELGTHLRQALIGQGAETIAFLILGGSLQGMVAHAIPSNHSLVPGELVRLDMGGFFGGWASDLAKTACVGDPSPRQRHIYRTLRSLLDEHIARIRPGTTAGNLFNAVVSGFQRACLKFGAPHVGHGIGLSVHEWPILSAGNPALIQPGMVISAELIYIEEDRERYHLEELVHVQEGETKVISDSRPVQKEIPVIG